MRSIHSRIGVSLLLLAVSAVHASPARMKELVEVQGFRENELFGYGLVVGLSGTGDNERVFFTSQSISGMLGRLGIRVDPRDVRSRNVAAVMVTARLPTFSRPGTRLDVQVSSMGDARSLAGGVLLITPLTGADGAVYAVAQGAVQAGGFQASGGGTWVQRNQPTSGRVPEGASVEKAVIPDLSRASLVFNLKRPDFTTAKNIADVMNGALGAGAAKALDAAAVEVKVPQAFKGNVVGMIAKVELLEVEADQRAKIVISERTGTVVAGEHVRLRPAAVAQGGLQVTIQNVQSVSQPGPFSGQGNTAVINNASINADEESRAAVALPAATSVQELVKALNMLGSKPRDLIAILQALKAAGALDADLEVM